MKQLEDSNVCRGGQHIEEFDLLEQEETNVYVEKDDGLIVRTSIRSKGGGRTTVVIQFGYEDYPIILDYMLGTTNAKHSLELVLGAIDRRESRLIRDVTQRICHSLAGRILDSGKESAVVPLEKSVRDAVDEILRKNEPISDD